jgi:hypothetical protein
VVPLTRQSASFATRTLAGCGSLPSSHRVGTRERLNHLLRRVNRTRREQHRTGRSTGAEATDGCEDPGRGWVTADGTARCPPAATARPESSKPDRRHTITPGETTSSLPVLSPFEPWTVEGAQLAAPPRLAVPFRPGLAALVGPANHPAISNRKTVTGGGLATRPSQRRRTPRCGTRPGLSSTASSLPADSARKTEGS